MSTDVQEINSEHSFAKRWRHHELFKNGYLAVPTLFLQHYADLGLTSSEALFVLQLMAFKWDAQAPFPGYKTVAKRMGISDKMTRRYAQALEQKNLLHRQTFIGRTNRFDLTPLFDALLATARKKARQQKKIAKPDAHSPQNTKTESTEENSVTLE